MTLVLDPTEQATFRTPRGRNVSMAWRTGTADFNNLRSCMDEDEYALAAIDLGAGIAIDVGAHIGGVTIGLALDNKDAHIIAIEALTANVEVLTQNVERAGVADRVTIIHAAASRPGRKSATVRWNFDGSESGQHHRFIGNATNIGATGGDEEKVAAVDLAHVTTSDVDFMKIDIEGGEYDFLASPAISRVRELRGEFHAGYAPLRELLDATHHVYLTSGNDTFGGFRAVRRD